MSESPKLDVIVLAAHPDDAELSAGGTICKMTAAGYKVGIVDFTRGELGTRGTPELRAEEAAEASRIMGISVRENLGIPDGNIENTPENREKIIGVIRRFRPHIALINAPECRHPDHADAARLSVDAMFYAGLRKIETREDGKLQEPWRPNHVLHYIQSVELTPTFVVDVTDAWPRRIEAMQAFKTQFHNPEAAARDDEPQTFISNPDFLQWIESRARAHGYKVGAKYGEPFIYRHGPVGVDDLVGVLSQEKKYR